MIFFFNFFLFFLIFFYFFYFIIFFINFFSQVTLDEFNYLVQEHSIRALWLQCLPEKFVIKKSLQVELDFNVCQLKKEVYKYVNTHEKKSQSLFGKKIRNAKKVIFYFFKIFFILFIFYFLFYFILLFVFFFSVSCSLLQRSVFWKSVIGDKRKV